MVIAFLVVGGCVVVIGLVIVGTVSAVGINAFGGVAVIAIGAIGIIAILVSCSFRSVMLANVHITTRGFDSDFTGTITVDQMVVLLVGVKF